MKLVFGDKKQIEELKRQAENTEFCSRCGAIAKSWWDWDTGDYYECENCRVMWWYENGKKEIEQY
jgi:DNA-directed RNA polymerase subunit RPC12/RpoP